MSSAELSRRVAAHAEDLRAISDTVIEIHDDVAQLKDDVAEIKTVLTGHSTALDELNSKLNAVLALLTSGKES